MVDTTHQYSQPSEYWIHKLYQIYECVLTSHYYKYLIN